MQEKKQKKKKNIQNTPKEYIFLEGKVNAWQFYLFNYSS
jgi:hypothetical protein